MDWIARSQLAEITNLKNSHICRTLKELEQRNIITRSGNKIGFNKYYQGWRRLPVGVRVHEKLPDQVSSYPNRPEITRSGGYKRNYTKDTLTKENNFSSDSVEYRLAEKLLEDILANHPNFKKPNLMAWAKHIDLMIRLDNRIPQKIEAVIEWCQRDSFWKSNILSTKKLREKYDQLTIKIGATNGSHIGDNKEVPKHMQGIKDYADAKGLDYRTGLPKGVNDTKRKPSEPND